MELGIALARGSRSVVHEYGPGAVAKVPLPETPEGWIRFEAIYTAAVADCGLDVPGVLGIEIIDGREVSVFERIDGPTMWDALIHDPGSAPVLGSQLAELHAQILSIRPPITLPSQRSRVLAKIAEAARTIDSSIARYADDVPESDGPMVLCHGDFHPKNIILGPRGPVVIDWFDASRGAGSGDIARTSILMRPTRTRGVGADVSAHLPGASSPVLDTLHTYYLAAVAESGAWPSDGIERWRPVQMAARLSEGVGRELLLSELSRHGGRAVASSASGASRI